MADWIIADDCGELEAWSWRLLKVDLKIGGARWWLVVDRVEADCAG